MQKKLLSCCEQALEEILDGRGMELVDIEMKKEGSNVVLRVYIDLLQGHISLNELEEVSRALSVRLDALYDADTPYVLEVSSPGVERVLKKPGDFVRFQGEKVDVKLFRPIEHKKTFTGILLSRNDDGLCIEVDGKPVTFENSLVAKVNLHFDF